MSKQYILTIDEDEVHLSEPGMPGTSFDTGENGDELKLAIQDMAQYLIERLPK